MIQRGLILMCLAGMLGPGCGRDEGRGDRAVREVHIEAPVLEVVHRLSGHEGPVTAIAFLDPKTVVSICQTDATLRIWSAQTGKSLHVFKTLPQPQSLALLPKGKGMIVAHAEGTIALWRIRDGAVQGRQILIETGGDQIALSRDGARLAVTRADDPIVIYDLASGVRIKKLPNATWAQRMDFGISSDLIVGAGDEGRVGMWAIKDEEKQFHSVDLKDGGIAELDYAPNGRHVAMAYRDGSVVLMDMRAREKLINNTYVSDTAAQAVRFHPDLPYFVTAHSDHRLYLWDGQSGQLIGKLEGHEGATTALAFDPSGNRLASGSADRQILIWAEPRSSDLPGPGRDHAQSPQPAQPHRVSHFGSPNLLLNPEAKQKHHFWKRRGLAYVLEQQKGNPCFGVRAGGSFWQDVALKNAAGKRLVLIGRVSVEKINAEPKHGMPFLFGTLHGGPEGKRMADLIDAKNMFCNATQPHQWSVAWGAFEVPQGVSHVRLFLNQAIVKGEAKHGAYFDDVGVYLFDTDEEAAQFFKKFKTLESN